MKLAAHLAPEPPEPLPLSVCVSLSLHMFRSHDRPKRPAEYQDIYCVFRLSIFDYPPCIAPSLAVKPCAMAL